MAFRTAVQKVLDGGAGEASKFLIGTEDKAVKDKVSGYMLQDSNQVPVNFDFSATVPGTPRLKFEYYVRINLSQTKDTKEWIESFLGKGTTEILIPYIKSVSMPSVDIETDTINQYNKKRISQTRLDFKPVSLIFHDLVNGKTLRFWEMYYEYYFKDGNADKMQRAGYGDNKIRKSTFTDDIISETTTSDQFGYNLGGVADRKYLIESIDIVQGRGENSAFKKTTIVHPRIESFSHDTLNYAGSELVEATMTFAYEDVIYTDREFTEFDYEVYGRGGVRYKGTGPKEEGITVIPGEKGLLDGIFDADLDLPIPADSPWLAAAAKGINAATSNIQQGAKSYVGDLPRQLSRAAGDSIFTGEISNPIDMKKAGTSIITQGAQGGGATAARGFAAEAFKTGSGYVDTIRESFSSDDEGAGDEE